VVCLSAGMDGYVTKPLKSGGLFAAMRELLKEQVEGVKAPSRSDVREGGVFDREQALASVDREMELLREVKHKSELYV
jgi:DNA-binding response OmpR family regulator